MRQHQGHKRRGAAVVEFAVVAPVLFLVIFGIIEFGRAMMVSHLVNNAARAGARKAILESSSNSEVEQVVKDFCTSGLGVDSDDVSVTITITAASGNDDPGGEIANAQAEDLCEVAVQVPLDKVSLMPPKSLGGVQITGRCSMQHE